MMIHIRELKQTDIPQAVELKAFCWPEELAGMSDEKLDTAREIEFWTDWMQSANEYDDIRLLIGAFEGDKLLGAAIASLAESEDIPESGVELNGLWVYPQHRGRGISVRLMMYVLDYYSALGKTQMVLYNMHHSPSNTYYRKFGFKVMRQDVQMKENVPVDVFVGDIQNLKVVVGQSLAGRDI